MRAWKRGGGSFEVGLAEESPAAHVKRVIGLTPSGNLPSCVFRSGFRAIQAVAVSCCCSWRLPRFSCCWTESSAHGAEPQPVRRARMVRLATGMGDIVVRGARDSRWKAGAERSEAILERLIAATAAGDVPLRLLIVVAHPDDEAIGAGALLAHYPDATIAHLTDGGGLGEGAAQSRGYRSREEYADTRRREVVACLSLIGIPPSRVRSLGIPDGAAGQRLVASCRAIMDLMDDVDPDVVLTHPYEGGHSDHDAAAFGVHLAAGLLRRDGEHAPIILELTSYHHANGRRVRGRFLHGDTTSARG